MDILNHIRYQVERERAEMPDNGLNESPGFLNSILGTISGASEEGVQNKRNAIKNAAGQRLLDQNGYTRAELGIGADAVLSEGLIGSKVRELKETKADRKSETAFNRSLVPLEKQMQAQENRYAFESSERAKDRSLERQLKSNDASLTRELALMESELADKRMAYDRETRRMDRRDAMIAQLMSGLGSLGGAFSI